MRYNLDGKTALITGGTSGIGLAAARLFLANGAKVTVAGRDPAKGAAALDELRAASPAVRYAAGDVARVAACESVAQQTFDHWGRIDILVNSAGIYLEKLLAETSEAEYDAVLDVNMKGTYFMCRAVLPFLRRGAGGAIVNVASDAGLNGNLLSSAYCASKGAVVAFTKALALECAPYQIRANCVCPGDVETPLLEAQLAADPHADRAAMAALYPLGRLAAADEIAAVIAFLADPAASFVTGAAWPVDGGLTAC